MIRKLLKRFIWWCIEDEMVTILNELSRMNSGISSNAEGIISLVNSGHSLQRLHNLNVERIQNLQDKFSEQLHIGVDLHMNSPHKIIVLGKHKNHEMVRIYDVDSDNMSYLIDILRQMQNDYGRRARITIDDFPIGYASAVREHLD